MKACAQWRDAVDDSALGMAQSAAFQTHLESCPNCADALRASRITAALIGAALGRQAAAEPPVYGPERVMARVGGGNPPRTNLWRRWAMAGCATAMLLVSLPWTRPTPRPSPQALASWRSPTVELLQPPVRAAWTAMPRLGEEFFEVRLKGEGERDAH